RPAPPGSPGDPFRQVSVKVTVKDSDTNSDGLNSLPSARPVLAAANDENNPPLPSAAGASATDAKSADPVEVKPKEDTFRIETGLVNLNVKAVNKAGQPITNLKQEDFPIFEDGVKQEVSHFKPVNAPVNVVILLDLSGSTQKKRKAMREAAEKFVDALPA